MTPDGSAAPEVAAPVRRARLQRLRWPLMWLAAVAILGGGAYFYVTTGRYQSTDDAYVQAATVSISADVAGRVSEVDVHDNEIGATRATLFDSTMRRFGSRSTMPQRASGRDPAANRVAQVDLSATAGRSCAPAKDTQSYAQQQYDRQTRLLASGIASQAQFDQALACAR